MSAPEPFASVHDWHATLLDEPVTPALRDGLPRFLKATAQAFVDRTPTVLGASDAAALDRWYASAEGQEAVVAAAEALWRRMAARAHDAMPAHDARHAMHKVPARALEYVAAEPVHGWARVGLLGALLHDYGRWAEERVFGFPGESVVHARLSFLLGREVLEGIDLPPLVRDQVLLAAVRHTSGAGPDDPLPLQLTVSADRDQLTSAEMVLRLAHHPVGPDGLYARFHDDGPGPGVLDELVRYLAHRLPGPLTSRQDEVDAMWLDGARAVLLADDLDAARRRFAVLRRSDGAVPRSLRPFDVDRAWQAVQVHWNPAADPAEALARLLAAPHVAPGAAHRARALAKVEAVPAALAARLGSALAFTDARLRAEDARQQASLRRIAAADPADRLVQWFAQRLRAA